MKSLKQFIKEEYSQYQLKDLTVKYDCEPQDIYIQCPETFQESDVQQYIDDVTLTSLPSSPDNCRKFFGDNMKNLNDAYFEYDKFEHINTFNKKPDIEWDEHLSSVDVKSGIPINTFKVTNMRYVLKFAKFDILNDNGQEFHEVLSQIFSAAESNDDNEYPIEIKYNQDELEFKK